MRSHVYHFIMSLALALMLGTAYMEASASSQIDYCYRQYNNVQRFTNLTPHAEKKCGLLFEKFTYEWMTGNYSTF